MLIVLFKKCLYLKGIFYFKLVISWVICIDILFNKNYGVFIFFYIMLFVLVDLFI